MTSNLCMNNINLPIYNFNAKDHSFLVQHFLLVTFANDLDLDQALQTKVFVQITRHSESSSQDFSEKKGDSKFLSVCTHARSEDIVVPFSDDIGVKTLQSMPLSSDRRPTLLSSQGRCSGLKKKASFI